MAFDLPTIEKYVTLTPAARWLISAPQAPIILAEMTKAGKVLAQIVAPDQTRLGFMLPYTPLHLLLLEPAPGFPEVLVMTSGNLSEEPIAYENTEARERLASLADGFLMHDRPIYMRIDDSVVTMLRENLTWCAGRAALPPTALRLPWNAVPLFATGTELKNYLLPHARTLRLRQPLHWRPGKPGDSRCSTSMPFAITNAFFVSNRRRSLVTSTWIISPRVTPKRAVRGKPAIGGGAASSCPYRQLLSREWLGWPEPVIGLAYDGTGYGTDGTIWGGEILIAGYKDFTRRFHLAPLPLPGADLAVRKPARMALSYLLAAGIDLEDQTLAPVAYLTPAEAQAVRHQARTGFNAPLTSSMGRLFDAVAALIGLCEEISYEAQAAMMLESAADPQESGFYEMPLENDIIDPLPMIRAIVADLKASVSLGSIAARFHNSLIRMSVEACRQIRKESGLRTVAISGGVWQNMRLMNLILPALEAEGFTPLIHTQLPPNDGCVSLGQAAVALARLQG